LTWFGLHLCFNRFYCVVLFVCFFSFFLGGGVCKRLLQPFVPLLKLFHYSFCQRFFVSACLNKWFDLIWFDTLYNFIKTFSDLHSSCTSQVSGELKKLSLIVKYPIAPWGLNVSWNTVSFKLSEIRYNGASYVSIISGNI